MVGCGRFSLQFEPNLGRGRPGPGTRICTGFRGVNTFTETLENCVEVLGLDATSKIVGQLLLDLVNRPESAETEALVPLDLAPEASSESVAQNASTVEISLPAAAACSAKQSVRRNKRPTRPLRSTGKRLKYKRFPKPKSLFDCKEELSEGRALVARFRDGEPEYVIKGIEGSTAYVPDGYVTSRGIKKEIDVKAAHHFWKVVGEVPTAETADLPMVRGRAYVGQKPAVPTYSDIKVGSLLENKSTGQLEFVAARFDGQVTTEVADGSLYTVSAPDLQSRFTLIGHSPDFEEEVAARA